MAPHKPILLITLLQSFRKGVFNDNRVYINPELVALFKSNWNQLVITNHDCRFSLPFYHLKSEGFWKLIPKPGFENILQMSASMRSFSNLNAAVDCAYIENDLVALMADITSNEVLTQLLLDEYFPGTKSNFSNSLVIQEKLFEDIENQILNEPAEEYRKEIKELLESKQEEEIYLRGSMFKREIPKIYNNSCCISGMKVDAILNVSMIDACHIIPFSVSYDDTVTNGIALCPNLHRAFDRGLIAIGESYQVEVSNSFVEDESAYSLKVFQGRKIQLPNSKKHYPNVTNLEWHKANIFKG